MDVAEPTGARSGIIRARRWLLLLPALLLPAAMVLFEFNAARRNDRRLWRSAQQFCIDELHERLEELASRQEFELLRATTTTGTNAGHRRVVRPVGLPWAGLAHPSPDLPAGTWSLVSTNVDMGMVSPSIAAPDAQDFLDRCRFGGKRMLSAITVVGTRPDGGVVEGLLMACPTPANDGTLLVWAVDSGTFRPLVRGFELGRWLDIQLENAVPDGLSLPVLGSRAGVDDDWSSSRRWLEATLRQGEPPTRFLGQAAFSHPEFQVVVRPTPEFFRTASMRGVVIAIPVWMVSIFTMCWLLWRLQMSSAAIRRQNEQLRGTQQKLARLDLLRSLIQQELHDHIIQSLTSLALRVSIFKARSDAGALEAFGLLQTTLTRQLDSLRTELRKLLFDDPAKIFSHTSAEERLATTCDRYSADYRAQIVLQYEVPEDHAFAPEVMFRISRFTEELLSNAIRHGKANRITVRLEVPKANRLRLSVADNGTGFNPSTMTVGFGFNNMRNFIRLHNGQLSANPGPRGGMRVELEFDTW